MYRGWNQIDCGSGISENTKNIKNRHSQEEKVYVLRFCDIAKNVPIRHATSNRNLCMAKSEWSSLYHHVSCCCQSQGQGRRKDQEKEKEKEEEKGKGKGKVICFSTKKWPAETPVQLQVTFSYTTFPLLRGPSRPRRGTRGRSLQVTLKTCTCRSLLRRKACKPLQALRIMLTARTNLGRTAWQRQNFIPPYFHCILFQVPSGTQRLLARTTFEVLPVCPGAFSIFGGRKVGRFRV